MSDVLRDAAVTAGRIARQRQGLPEKLIDPVLIERLAVLWEQRPVQDESGAARDDAA